MVRNESFIYLRFDDVRIKYFGNFILFNYILFIFNFKNSKIIFKLEMDRQFGNGAWIIFLIVGLEIILYLRF